MIWPFMEHNSNVIEFGFYDNFMSVICTWFLLLTSNWMLLRKLMRIHVLSRWLTIMSSSFIALQLIFFKWFTHRSKLNFSFPRVHYTNKTFFRLSKMQREQIMEYFLQLFFENSTSLHSDILRLNMDFYDRLWIWHEFAEVSGLLLNNRK